MELKNINVIQGQSSSFQDFRCAVRWPGKEGEKNATTQHFFIDHCDQTSSQSILPNWESAWKPTRSPQKQLIFGVLRHINKISEKKKEVVRSYAEDTASSASQQQRCQVPEVSFRLESHGQSFVFRHDENSGGPISLKTQRHKFRDSS